MKGINKTKSERYSLLMIPFSLGMYLFMNSVIQNRVIPYIVKLLKIMSISDINIYTVSAIWMGIMVLSVILVCVLTKQRNIVCIRTDNLSNGLKTGWFVWLYSAACILISYQNSYGYRDFSYIFSAVIYYILVAVCEEIVFRVLIQCNMYKFLKSRFDDNKAAYSAVFISSLLFAAVHLSNAGAVTRKALLIQITGAFVYGLLFGIIVLKTDSLLSAILLHAVNDIASAYAVIILRTGKTAADIINGYGVMELLAMIPVLICCVIQFYSDLKTNEQP